MAANTRHGVETDACGHEGPVLGDRTCHEDPIACELDEALSSAENPTTRYHLRQALQLRLREDLRPERSR